MMEFMTLLTIFLFLSLTVSEPPDGKGSVSSSLESIHNTTNLRRTQQPHLAQSFPLWAAEDHSHQEAPQ